MAEVYCGSEPCPLFLNSTCVFYTGESLLYIGVQNNDTLETIIVKINQAFQNAGVGYAFTNGLIQPTPFQPVQLGGALIQNTTIGGNFTLSFTGNVQAARHITTGGSSSQFVKGDGTLDSTAYQPAANYITGLSGDATASGPGVAAMTLSTVNFAPGTFGNGNTIPIVTVNAKGLVTNITPVPVTIPPLPLTFIGDVVGSGFTGSSITLLMQNVNANPYNTITPLKFSVNGKGLVTGASPITASDIVNILGYYPGTSGTSGSDGTSGTSGTSSTSGTSGTDGSGGTSGTSGTTGTSGTSATSGTSGTSGTDGTGGTSGTSGTSATSGTSGTSGSTGTSGTSGTTGTSGSSGTSGSTGTSGSSGTTGTSGSSGTTGTSGSSGTSGTTGTSGSSGTSGTTGLDGSNGTSGTSGTTGTSGSSGTSGTTGTSGSSGTSGTTGTSGTSGLSGDRFKTTSTTTFTLLPAGASGTITVDPGLSYTPGQSIIIAYDANNHDEAEVTAYDPNTGSISFVVFRLTGSGTYSSWFVNIDGASGGDGSSGTSGTTGTSGSSGTSGTTGTSGSSGTSGTSATDGTSGTSGTTGVDGTSGSSGTSGTTGTSGSSGTSGTTGTSGSSGTSGTSATDGTGGTSGTSGSSGTSGTTGTSGTSATSGTSGTSATSGTTGTSGTSGTNGTGGTSGTSGTSATSGTSGTSGATGASGTSGTSGTSVAVSGTTNTMAKFTSSTTIGNSALTDNGSTLTYTGSTIISGTASPTGSVIGGVRAYGSSSAYMSASDAVGRTAFFGVDASDYIMFGALTNHDTVIRANNTAYFRVYAAGYTQSEGSSRAPIFFDSSNTNYYIDPASTTSLRTVGSWRADSSAWDGEFNGKIQYHGNNWYIQAADSLIYRNSGGSNVFFVGQSGQVTTANNYLSQLNTASGLGNLGFLTSASIVGNIHIQNGAGPGADNSNQAAITFQGGNASQAQAGIYVLNNNSYGTSMGFATTDSYAIGPQIFMTASNIGVVNFTRNRPTFAGNVILDAANYTSYTLPIGGSWYGVNTPGSRWGGYAVSGGEIVFGNGLPNPGQMGILIDGAYVAGENNGFWSLPSDNNWNGRRGMFWDGSQLNFTTNSPIALFSDARAPIFYDSNNTGYYFDGASGTNLNYLNVNGTWGSSPFGSGHAQLNINGTYPSITQRQTDGSQGYWLHHVSFTGIYHLYGGRGATNGTDWDWSFRAYPNQDGNRVEFRTDVRAPIFYDLDNTAYYINAASTSNLDSLQTAGQVVIGGNFSNNAYNAVSSTRLMFGGADPDAQSNYFIGTNLENYGGNYTKLDLRWHTGIRMGAQPGYGGIRIFNNEDLGSRIASFGETDANVRIDNILYVYGDMRSPIFYDSNNTGYYCDPNSSTQLRTVYADDWFRPQGCTGVYWQSYGRGMWSPECEGNSYGNVTTYGGGRNGWQGWGIGSRHVFMSTGGDNVGVHDNSRGWIWYWNGSFTSFDFGYTQFAGSARAPIFYDSANTGYYLDPNGGSYLAGSIEIANGYTLTQGVGGSIYMDSSYGSFGGYIRFGKHGVIETTTGSYHIYVLDQNGTGVVKYYGAQSWSAQSDGRIKNVHSVMQNNLSKLDGINPIYYSFNNFDDDKNRIGLIAQEVQQHFPELVTIDPKTEYLTLDYTGLVPVLLGAIKELKTEIETLKTRI